MNKATNSLKIESTLLDTLPPEAKDHFLLQYRLETHPKKTMLFFQDDRCEKMYEIVRGQVKLSTFTADGKELIIELLREGDRFGFIPLVDSNAAECTATALSDVVLMTMNQRDFCEMIRKYPIIVQTLLRDAGKRIRKAYSQMEHIFAGSVHKRVARLLLEMARQEGSYQDNVLTFNIRLTHQELANLAGTSRETVTRILTQLKNENYIKVQRSTVSILREADMELVC